MESLGETATVENNDDQRTVQTETFYKFMPQQPDCNIFVQFAVLNNFLMCSVYFIPILGYTVIHDYSLKSKTVVLYFFIVSY